MLSHKADIISLRSLMNSLVRDFHSVKNILINNNQIQMVSGDSILKVGLSFYSRVGLHQYNGQMSINDKEINFDDLLNFIEREFSAGETFVKRIRESRRQIKRNLSLRGEVEWKDDYLSAEQSLYFGHPLHPYPKLKGEMDDEEITAFCPEFRNGFKLVWLKVIAEQACFIGHGLSQLEELYNFDLGDKIILEDGVTYLPIHPLQLKKFEESDFFSEKGLEVIEKIEGLNDWYACSSVRTLYATGAPCSLKFSLDIRLTNSKRNLNGGDLGRSDAVNAVFSTPKLKDFFTRYKNFEVHQERLFGGFKDNKNSIIDESIFQLRDPVKAPGKTLLLASLCENDGESKAPIIKLATAENEENKTWNNKYRINLWYRKFLENVIDPFLALAFEEGVLLGAHLQNILIEIESNDPIGAIYRDCQGTGLTPEGQQSFKDILPETALVIDHENTKKVFGYYLILNSVYSTLAALAGNDSETELQLLHTLRTFFYRARVRYLIGETFFSYLLEADEIYQKGNFRCTVGANDENTMSDPWSIYNTIPNPLKCDLREVRNYECGHYLYEKTLKRNGSLLQLRKLDIEKDLDIFHEWHNKDYVSEFWEMNVSKEELRDYIQGLYDSPYQLPLILELNGSPIGYFEYYWAYEDRIAPYCEASLYDRGFHLLFGEEKILRTRYIFDALAMVSGFAFYDEPKTQNVWGEPRADNEKTIKFSLALPGWEKLHEFSFPHKRSRLVRCARDRYEKESK